MDLKETREVKEFVVHTLQGLNAAKANDGKITLIEIAHVAIEERVDALAAYKDAAKMKDELKDLDPEEVKELAGYGLELLSELANLLIPSAG